MYNLSFVVSSNLVVSFLYCSIFIEPGIYVLFMLGIFLFNLVQLLELFLASVRLRMVKTVVLFIYLQGYVLCYRLMYMYIH